MSSTIASYATIRDIVDGMEKPEAYVRQGTTAIASMGLRRCVLGLPGKGYTQITALNTVKIRK
jgi:hypothetical protein